MEQKENEFYVRTLPKQSIMIMSRLNVSATTQSLHSEYWCLIIILGKLSSQKARLNTSPELEHSFFFLYIGRYYFFFCSPTSRFQSNQTWPHPVPILPSFLLDTSFGFPPFVVRSLYWLNIDNKETCISPVYLGCQIIILNNTIYYQPRTLSIVLSVLCQHQWAVYLWETATGR